MKYRLVLAGLGVTAALSTTALAAPEDSGIDLGLRLGYGIPLGIIGQDLKLNDYVTGQVPIWIDAGYRFTPNIIAGLYFQYGFGFLADNICPSPADCSAHDIRVGIQGQYRFLPKETANPWLGIGFGYEWLGLSVSATTPVGSIDASIDAHGFEFVNLQGGVDFKVAEGVGIGPFLSFSLDEYSNASASTSGLAAFSGSGEIQNKALHEWLTLGVRATFDP
jgi:hypothetical protein